ncbi:MAG: GNAT family N-acetyltransferase, partial [Mycobacteriaceae bacterium]
MSNEETKPAVTKNPDRFELRVDGELVGFADYQLQGDRMVLPHTEIDPASGGRGLGGVLVRAALDDVRAQGLKAVPACSFVDHYITRNPEYADLRA